MPMPMPMPMSLSVMTVTSGNRNDYIYKIKSQLNDETSNDYLNLINSIKQGQWIIDGNQGRCSWILFGPNFYARCRFYYRFKRYVGINISYVKSNKLRTLLFKCPRRVWQLSKLSTSTTLQLRGMEKEWKIKMLRKWRLKAFKRNCEVNRIKIQQFFTAFDWATMCLLWIHIHKSVYLHSQCHLKLS